MKNRTPLRLLAALIGLLLLMSAAPAMAASATAQAVTGAEPPDFSLNVELTVLDGTVTVITVYGATGEILLTSEVTGDTTPSDALSATLASAQEAGYLAADGEEPYLLITTAGGILDAAVADSLRQLARDFMRDTGREAEVDYTAIGVDVSAKAATLGLPGGRYLMMQYIAQQQGIPVEEAIAQYGSLKVRDLMRSFEGLREAMGEQEQLQEQEQDQEQLQEQEQDQEQEQLQEQDQEQEQQGKPEDTGKPDDRGQGSDNGKGNGNKGGKK